MVSQEPIVSIVVPAYKSAETIAKCLESLASQETDLPYEVTVVESSGDGAAGIVREQFPWARLIESPVRLLSGAARNLGAAASTGELLLFIDSDCVAEADWIEKMRQAHKEFDGAGVAGAVLNGNPENPVAVASYITEFSVFFDLGETRRMDYLPSCNLSYKMDVFRKYGGFDPDQPLYVDLMFNKRLSAAGEKLLFRPDIGVQHWHRTTLKEYLRHELSRGKSAVAARRKGLLVGKWWVAHPFMASLAVPLLFLHKSFAFPYRFMRTYPSGGLIRALPYVWMGLACWHYAFLMEMFRQKGPRDAG